MKIKYLIIGVLNTIFSVTLFYALLQILQNVQYQLILFVCFIIANIQSHITQRVLVWKSLNPYFSELMRFFMGAIGIFVINLLLLTFLVDFLGYETFESQVLLTLVLTIANYFFQKHAVFKATE
jgi:putative flippase GtrA